MIQQRVGLHLRARIPMWLFWVCRERTSWVSCRGLRVSSVLLTPRRVTGLRAMKRPRGAESGGLAGRCDGALLKDMHARSRDGAFND